MNELIVSDIMTRDLVGVSKEANLLECAKKMVFKKVSSVLILEQGKLLGLISQKDIIWAITKKKNLDLTKIKALDISPKKIGYLSPESSIRKAIAKMNQLKTERLPVIKENKVVGILSAKDILNVHPEVYPELEEFYKIREQSEKLKRIKSYGKRKFGRCEKCGEESYLIYTNGIFLCESCRENI
jgi:CBS domain-containing protein